MQRALKSTITASGIVSVYSGSGGETVCAVHDFYFPEKRRRNLKILQETESSENLRSVLVSTKNIFCSKEPFCLSMLMKGLEVVQSSTGS